MMESEWKELTRGEGEQDGLMARPVQQRLSNSSSASQAQNYQTVDEGEGILESGFVAREISRQAIRSWVSLQAVAVIFQLLLWREVSSHLQEFDQVIAEECAPERLRHGVCVGPMWNISAYADTVVHGGGISGQFEYNFQTRSNPPTFLVVVDPVSSSKASEAADPKDVPVLADQKDEETRVMWWLEVTRTKPAQGTPPLKRHHAGQQAVSFEDLSSEAHDAVMAPAGTVEWKATIRLRNHRLHRKVRFVSFVEDAKMNHLGGPGVLGNQAHCGFSRSWKAFNEQHQGHSHQKLAWCSWLLGVFVFVGGGVVYYVYMELHKKKGMMGNKFHLVVLAKFALQDVPQQLCMVLYVLGWFEAGGLRCQLCLFHPEHCSEESAFSAANSFAFLLTLLSSIANQLLVRPVIKKKYTEDDICLQYCLRIGAACVSVLPFTTGLCLATKTVIPATGFLHLFAAVPLVIGYLTLSGLVCVPLLSCCDEDCEGEC